MIIDSIKLKNFRNYHDCELFLSSKVNVFVGDNAQGKTNMLESISFISNTRSFRTSNDQDMIKNGEAFTKVAVSINDNESKLLLAGLIFKEGKQLLIQKQPIKKASEFIGLLNAVVFAPDDLELFDGAPRLRRRLCDLEIGKTNHEYMRKLNQYQKTLKERNAFLKSGSNDDDYLGVLTDRLIELQVFIVGERHKYINKLNAFISGFYQLISKSDQSIKIQYFAPIDDVSNTKAMLFDKYQKTKERDKLLKQTQVGIHKDDLLFYLDEYTVQSYASQGQKRMIILSLKMALIKYIYEKTKTYPVLLLDDVLSELDATRKKSLFDLIPSEVQTIITTTDINDVKDYLPADTKIFSISDGNIVKIQEMKR